MKIDRLETHDRLVEFKKQSSSISECCQDLINQRPFEHHPFYIFAHARTDEDGFSKRLLWQPRLTKPRAQTNSMLFKAYPGTDKVRVIWMIPARELWQQYKEGKVTESDITRISIDLFENDRNKLESPEEDDLDDKEIDAIYRSMSLTLRCKKLGLFLG